MSFFSGIASILRPVARPIGNAADSVAGSIGDLSNSSLFGSRSSLLRALANPGDAVAVGQVFDNTAIKGQSPQTQVKNADGTVSPVVHQVGVYHQELWYHIQDGASWVYHAVIDLWHGIWYNIRNLWRQTGFRNHFDQLGTNIKVVVDKWGGERRVVAWAVVVVVVIVVIIIEIVTWGAATPAIGPGGWALIMALLSFGVQQGLTPDAPDALPFSLFGGDTIDNTKFNSTNSSNSSSGGGQVGSFLDQLANALANLPVPVLIGAAAIGTLGVYYLLAKR